jgi:divalent metal cation (Fe/Co/Zn/Cd) transporter
VGTKVNSDSLVNSGEDATLDSIISASTLVAAVIFMLFGLSLEAWLGAIISLVIIKSGFEMLKDTISQILGERSDPDLAKSIKQTVTEFEGVEGAYDLVLNNYGPDAWNGSVHIEVPDTYSADQLDRLIREIQMKVYSQHQVILTAIGVYSINTKDDEAKAIEQKVREIVFAHEHVLQMHGFYLTKESNNIRFDVVVSFDAPNRRDTYRQIIEDVQKAFPDYQLQIALDTDFSEE